MTITEFDPLPLKFIPGVVKDRTRRANELGWWDTDMVRFVEGLPQTIGGWSRPFTAEVIGTPRALFAWFDLEGFQLMGIGTEAKYYIESGGTITDITPVRRTAALAADPIATTNGSSVITVTDASHGASAGDYVTLAGSSDVNGVLAASINAEHVIVTATLNTYTVDTGDLASGTGSGGGAAVTAEYQVSVGLNTTVVGGGYGAGTWGRGTWDSAAATTVQGAQLRVWTQDNWGEDFLVSPRGDGIYHYDRSAPDRAVNLDTLPGASDVPEACNQVMVASDVRHLLAFGCTEFGGSGIDEMVWRWTDQESLINWTPSTTSAAGGSRFLVGSRVMQAVKTRQEIGVFTDRALYSVQYVGAPDFFVPRLISPNVKIAGPKAAGFFGDAIYWMGARGFHGYSGQVFELPCPIKEYVFRDINLFQLWKTHCAVNSLYGELWFFYCSAASEEIDRYAMVKMPEMYWANGTLPRTAWLDNDVFTLPRAADPDGLIYDQETGYNDGSETPSLAIPAHAESSPFLISHGSRAMRIRSIWPDIDYLDSINADPEVTLVLKLQNKPGTAIHGSTSSGVVQTVSVPVQVFTDKVDIGKRARLIAFRIQSEQKDLQWRAGVQHMELRPDGRR